MTSLAGETKYLKQVKIQGTLKHFWEGKNWFNYKKGNIQIWQYSDCQKGQYSDLKWPPKA